MIEPAAIEEALESMHQAGQQAGAAATLIWIREQISARLALAGRYDDTRRLQDLLVAVSDRYREVHGDPLVAETSAVRAPISG